MLIIASEKEKEELKKQCDGRCSEDKWCVFKNFLECPIDDGHIETTEKISINTIIK